MAESEAKTSGDPETDARVARGVKPDCLGWKQIAALFGIGQRTACDWEAHGLPVVSWGPKLVAGYSDRLLAWAMTRRGAAA